DFRERRRRRLCALSNSICSPLRTQPQAAPARLWQISPCCGAEQPADAIPGASVCKACAAPRQAAPRSGRASPAWRWLPRACPAQGRRRRNSRYPWSSRSHVWARLPGSTERAGTGRKTGRYHRFPRSSIPLVWYIVPRTTYNVAEAGARREVMPGAAGRRDGPLFAGDESQHEMETARLGNRNVFATVAVKDIEVARKFYEDTLGFVHDGPRIDGVLNFRSGATMF